MAHRCPGDYESGHPLCQTLWRHRQTKEEQLVFAVRTPECELNDTKHTWVLLVWPGGTPHPFDWFTTTNLFERYEQVA